jgi:16S rRNA processing protein RimM
MIYRKKKLLTVGAIVRTHGVYGSVVVRFLPGADPLVLEKEGWCFLSIRGKPVPFALKKVYENNNGEAVVEFNGVDSKPDTEFLIGLELSVEQLRSFKKQKVKDISLLKGYAVFNNGAEVGTILDIESTGKQYLFVLEDEKLIPVHDDLINSINDIERRVYMDLPEGLI